MTRAPLVVEAGPRTIESHARVGGAGIADIVRLAYGVDLPQLTVGLPLGLLPPPPSLPTPGAGAAGHAILPAPGTITALHVPADLPDSVIVALGCAVADVIRPLLSGCERKAGVVVARAASTAGTTALSEQVAPAIGITVSSVDRGSSALKGSTP
ncbi:hypothetical protein [Kitasatospora sp. NPDC059327]|uniref:hypothetical protein n=1 Tax=Kitasatospora sp. NPDC059327 TaxID=3346803 RepID=UPI003676379E